MIAGLAMQDDLKEVDGMWCVAALRNLLSTSANHRPMLKEGVVDALVKMAESPYTFISLNATASLRSMTYNVATREALISKNAINVIIDDTNAGDADDDLKIGSKLLQKIEAESWANGSRGVQREGRVEELERQPLMLGFADETGAVMIEVPFLDAGWNKVECKAEMEEPTLERKAKSAGQGGTRSAKARSVSSAVGENGSERLLDGLKDSEMEVIMVTRICPKRECDTVMQVRRIESRSDKLKNSF